MLTNNTKALSDSNIFGHHCLWSKLNCKSNPICHFVIRTFYLNKGKAKAVSLSTVVLNSRDR